jgi:bifunctional DNA-binding transcriptional regulator/antitoxin component of YhaV-PrlF toxin-antitoxin module
MGLPNGRRLTRLTIKNQTTIPKDICQKKGLRPGDIIQWELDDEGNIVVKKVVDDSALEEFIGILKTKKSTQEIISELRGKSDEDCR